MANGFLFVRLDWISRLCVVRVLKLLSAVDQQCARSEWVGRWVGPVCMQVRNPTSAANLPNGTWLIIIISSSIIIIISISQTACRAQPISTRVQPTMIYIFFYKEAGRSTQSQMRVVGWKFEIEICCVGLAFTVYAIAVRWHHTIQPRFSTMV